MKAHPDRSDAPDAVERFNEIGRAYADLLGDSAADQARRAQDEEEQVTKQPHVTKPKHAAAYADWVYQLVAYLEEVPQRFDRWLPPSYASTIYQHLRANELAEALEVFEEQKQAGEVPTHAVYEMLMRGCTIAMRRVGPGEEADHFTQNLIGKVVELWTDMEAMGRKPDYLTYNELIRAYGKAGRIKEAMVLFETMCGNVKLLPEERAINSMYELCVLSGSYREAVYVFEQHEELKKSLWNPRFTPVSFSLLLTACAEPGPGRLERMDALPRVLGWMGRQGVLPRDEACERLLGACVETRQLQTAKQVLKLAARAGHTLDSQVLDAVTRLEQQLEAEASGAAAPLGAGGGEGSGGRRRRR